MPCRDVVSWNAMIAAYARNGASEMALSIFKQMQGEVVMPNELTFRSALGACANTIALAEGKRIHAHVVLQLDLVLRTALVKMYGRCGNVDEAWLVFVRPPVEDLVLWTAMLAAYAHCGLLEDAMIIFEMIPERDVVCWSAIIGAHAQHGCAMDALHLFHQMQLHGLSPNKVTFISILNAYASLAALDEGRWIHGQIHENRLDRDIVVDNALVNMYGKCGSIIDAQNVFNGMSKRDVISWSAIIAAYAQHGYGRESLELFQNMQQEGFVPDNILLGSILSACSHAGHLDHGFHFFLFVSKEYWTAPTVEHHNCFIDLLGRSGMLENAEDLINHMVMEPTATTWMAMLGASVVHRDTRNARQAAKHVSSLDPGTIAPYVLLSNMYAAIGWWEDLVKVRRMINNKTVNNICWEDLD